MRSQSAIFLAGAVLAAILLAVPTHMAHASGNLPPDYVREYIPDAQLVGAGRLNVFVFDVYDAALYATHGRFEQDRAFALSLTYRRNIEAGEIAKISVEEMRKMGLQNELQLADWYAQMRKIFPDVGPGSVLTGIYTPGGETVFYDRNAEIGRVRDPQFGRYFFNIWLGEDTSVPQLRQKLLGTNG